MEKVLKMMFAGIFVIVFASGVAGCASLFPKTDKDKHIDELNTRISELKEEVKEKDEEIRVLSKQTGKAASTGYTATAQSAAATSKNIQIALKNAGYYSGPIDGKIGSKSKQAIMDFQATNNLKADGVVGKKTWALLSRYLEKVEAIK